MSVDIPSEGAHARLATSAGFGRPTRPTLAERREAAQRRLMSMAEVAGAVDDALARLENRLDALGAGDPSGVTRESVRALLGVACRVPGYDATLALDGVRVRVRSTATGLDVAVAAAAPTAPAGIPLASPYAPREAY